MVEVQLSLPAAPGSRVGLSSQRRAAPGVQGLRTHPGAPLPSDLRISPPWALPNQGSCLRSLVPCSWLFLVKG